MSFQNSVIAIYNKDFEICGTGFYIGEDKIITCSHVIEAAKGKKISLSDEINIFKPGHGYTMISKVDKFCYYKNSKIDDLSKDICILSLKEHINNYKLEKVNFHKNDNIKDSNFVSYGFPYPSGNNNLGIYMEGNVMAEINFGLYQIHNNNSNFHHGLSGSPVIEKKSGEVIGMLARKSNDNIHAYVIPLKKIKDFYLDIIYINQSNYIPGLHNLNGFYGKYSYDGKIFGYISNTNKEVLVLRNAAEFTLKNILSTDTEISNFIFSPDNTKILLIHEHVFSSNIKIYNLNTNTEITTITHNINFFSSSTFVKYSPNGKILITYGTNKYLKIWDGETFEKKQTFHINDNYEILGLDISPDNKTICVLLNEFLELINLDSYEKIIYTSAGQCGNKLNNPKYNIDGSNIALIDPDCNGILILDSMIYTLEIYNAHSKTYEKKKFTSEKIFLEHYEIMAITYSNNGKYMASISKNGLIKVWTSSDYKEFCTYKSTVKSCNDISFSPDSKKIVINSQDNSITEVIEFANNETQNQTIILTSLSNLNEK